MADSNVLMRRWLLGEPSVTRLLGSNRNEGVYCGDLIEGFDPSLGPAIQITTAGGKSHPEIVTVSDDVKQLRVWADKEQYKKARQLYSACQRLMHGVSNVPFGVDGYVIRCLEIVSGQDVTDPDTGWATVIGKFQFMFRDS